MAPEADDPRTPVTLLTGWLGAGKTTLLNRILSDPGGRRFAVLVNEFGEIGVDDRLVVRADEDLVELNNGCVCCTVRGDLVRTLTRLRRRKPPFFRRREFDHVLIETTGVAEPAPLLRTFLVEADIAVCYVVQAIVGIADSHSLNLALSEPAAVEQMTLADLLLLNKVDLCTPEETDEVQARLQELNPAAPIIQCSNAKVSLDEVLRARPPRGLADLPEARRAVVDGDAHHVARSGIESVSLRASAPLDGMKVQLWLDAIASMLEGRLIRYKGFLDLAQEPRRGILQGVYELYTVSYGEEWQEDEPRATELVFIGRDLDRDMLERGMRACQADVTTA